jgi:uncharacterized protein YqgV (UPF0045/DUF77 family)
VTRLTVHPAKAAWEADFDRVMDLVSAAVDAVAEAHNPYSKIEIRERVRAEAATYAAVCNAIVDLADRANPVTP